MDTWATHTKIRRVRVVVLALGVFAAGAAAGAMRSDRMVRQPSELLFVCYHTKVSEWECPDTRPDTSSGAGSSAAMMAKSTAGENTHDPQTARKQMPKKLPPAAGARHAGIYDADVSAVTVTFTLMDKRTVTRSIPAIADAVFFTRTASRKFLLRYYRDTFAVDKAKALEARLNRAP